MYCNRYNSGLAMRSSLAAMAMVLVLVTGLRGQGVKSSFVGTITDSSGATVTGAHLTVRNLDTNVQYSVVSDAAGSYVVPFLDPGRYSVTAENAGFKTAVEPEVKLDVAATVRVDLHLQVGEASERVEVSAAAPLVQSDSSEVGMVVTRQELTQLPLLGRNFEALSQLTPTAVAPVTNPVTQYMPALTTGTYYQVAGQRGAYTVYTFDGIETNNWMGYQSSGILPSLDAIGEFKVQTHNASAEYGRSSIQYTASTRSGTNQFHGSAYEYLRNTALNANDFFANKGGQSKGAFRYNQFGATIGGPVHIPKLYSGRDRTFFFFGYEGTRYVSDATSYGNFPDPAWLTGDFSGLRNTDGSLRPIYDPATVRSNGQGGFIRDVFPGNVIPSSRFDPVAKAATQFIPKPTGLVQIIQGSNTVGKTPTISSPNQFVTRLDHNVSSNDRFYGRYMQSRENQTSASLAPLSGSININHGYNAMLAETHVFSSTMVNEFRMGFNRANYGNYQEGGTQGCITACQSQDYAQQVLHLANIGIGPAGYGLPAMSWTGYSGIGGPVDDPFGLITNTYQFTDNLIINRNRHALKMGFSYGRVNAFYSSPTFSRGSFAFNGQFTQGTVTGQTNSGSPFADFLLGYANSSSGLAGNPSGHFHTAYQGYYVQDDYRVSSRLTLNLGLRWEFYVPYSAADSSGTSRFAFGSIPGSCFGAGCPAGHIDWLAQGQELWKRNWNNWAPRIGLAYSPFGDNRTVIRAAYGIFYSPTDGTWAGGVGVLDPPNSLNFSFTPSNPFTDLTSTRLSGLFPGGVIPPVSQLRTDTWPLPAIAIFTQLPVEKDAAIQQWQLTIQRELSAGTIVELGYLGSQSYHGQRVVNYNQARLDYPGQSTSISSRLPYPSLSSLMPTVEHVGNSNYEAGFVRVEKRLSHGLSFIGAYTFSKSLDDAGNTNAPDTFWPVYSYNIRLEHGVSYFNAPHRFSMGYTWELPFGRHQRFGSSMNPGLDIVLGGWQVNGITTFQSGNPLVLGLSREITNTGNPTGGRPNVVGPVVYEDPRSTGYWFNPSAFAVPALGTIGNASRGVLFGPGINNWDLGIGKNFRLHEEATIQFRAEMFNAFNHTQFSGAYTTVDPSVQNLTGLVTSARAPRNVQFGLRIEF